VKPMAIAREEIFGPSLRSCAREPRRRLRARERLRIPLTGASSRAVRAARTRATRIARAILLNRGITGAIVERHPFGGFKLSGAHEGRRQRLLEISCSRAHR